MQTDKIYRTLEQSANLAADEALRQGMRWAESDYQDRILAIMLERESQQSMQTVIANYHKMAVRQRRLVHQKVKSLYTALRRCGGQSAVQTRLNVLLIIRQCYLVGLADIAVMLLHDHHKKVARLAGEVLLELARYFVRTYPRERIAELRKKQGAGHVRSDYDYLAAALRSALDQYGKIHRCGEVVQAAMLFADAEQQVFWEHYFEPHHIVGVQVRKLLAEREETELAGFMLSALGNQVLRPSTVRAMSRRLSPAYLRRLAGEFPAYRKANVLEGMRRVQNPLWLDGEHLRLEELSSKEQIRLIEFIAHLGVEQTKLLAYIDRVLPSLSESAAKYVIGKLDEMSNPQAEQSMAQALDSPYENAVLDALTGLIRRKSKRLPGIMLAQLKSPHPRVRAVAQRYYEKIAFTSYWRNFNRLTRQERIAAGRAVLKLDPRVAERWKEKVRSSDPADRLKAVLMARELDQTPHCLETFLTLLRDNDSRVRSCAVAGLGELSEIEKNKVDAHLQYALGDPDTRVQANAVEALTARNVRDASARIASFVKSDDNRLRANAIKAMLKWKVASANRAVGAMLADRRPAHQCSATWLARTIAAENTTEKTHTHKERDRAVPLSV